MYLNYFKSIVLLFSKCINLLNVLQLLFTYEFFPFRWPLGCSSWCIVTYLGTDVGASSEAQPFPRSWLPHQDLPVPFISCVTVQKCGSNSV